MRKASLLFALMLSSCAVGPDFKMPGFDMPDAWPWQKSLTVDPALVRQENIIAADWWKSFNDQALSALIAEGMTENADLVRAASRVAQARALVGTRQADFFPTLDVQGQALRTSRSREAIITPGFGGISKPFNDFGIAAVLNYELDLWGRLRRANESARAQLLANESNRDAIRIAVASEIAQSYFNLRSLDAQVEITNNTVDARREALKFQETQYRLGGENGLTYRQAQAELQAALASAPALEQARNEQETALAILLGRTPKAIVEDKIVTGKSIDALPAAPALPAALPSTLLERRPDIQSAEQALVAANAEIGVARAEYFPRISLTGLLGLSSSQADRVLRSSARNWQGGATLAGPLVDFGRTRALVDTATARKDEAIADYQQIIRQAFKEVLDTISAQRTSEAREKAQTAQVNARSETLRLAGARYKAGYSNYLEVLDAQRLLYQSQLERVLAKRDRLIAEVNLYKALGGGWPGPQKQK